MTQHVVGVRSLRAEGAHCVYNAERCVILEWRSHEEDLRVILERSEEEPLNVLHPLTTPDKTLTINPQGLMLVRCATKQRYYFVARAAALKLGT